MHNIKQITDLTTNNREEIIKDRITVAGSTLTNVSYYRYTLDGTAIKLGYCCEVKGIGYPIFLTFDDNTETAFEIGKTGMYEFQPEDYYDVNADTEEKTAIIKCIKVAIPADLKFTLDYWTE